MKSEIFKNFCEICALRILFLNFLRIKRDEMMADQIDKGSIVTNADANANACDEAELAIEDSDPNPVYNSNLLEFIEFFSRYICTYQDQQKGMLSQQWSHF